MISRVDEFRQRARHCEQLALEAADVAKRKFFQDLARQWRDLASDAELLDRKRVMTATTSTPDIHQQLFNVRFGSKADMCSAKRHVRFTPESGHVQRTS